MSKFIVIVLIVLGISFGLAYLFEDSVNSENMINTCKLTPVFIGKNVTYLSTCK
jgi:hypothetical protein